MIPQMTNEQFALWIAATKGYNPSDMKKIADDYYEWLESKNQNKEPGWNNPLVDYLDWEEKYNKSLKELAKQKEERELIKNILDDRSNANGHDKEGNPKYIYDGYEYILNTSCNKILSTSFERKFKLDDSFKERLKEAVVEDVPAVSWMDEYYDDYIKLQASGMMFEFHPTWTGEWDKDKYAFCYNRGWEKTSTQDPATIEDIHNIYEEMTQEEIDRMNLEEYEKMLEIEETDEEAAYRKGYMDGYDEGLYDGQYK